MRIFRLFNLRRNWILFCEINGTAILVFAISIIARLRACFISISYNIRQTRSPPNRTLETDINDEIQRDYLEFILGPFHVGWIIQDSTELESALTRINTPYEQFVTLNTAPLISIASSKTARISVIKR